MDHLAIGAAPDQKFFIHEGIRQLNQKLETQLRDLEAHELKVFRNVQVGTYVILSADDNPFLPQATTFTWRVGSVSLGASGGILFSCFRDPSLKNNAFANTSRLNHHVFIFAFDIIYPSYRIFQASKSLEMNQLIQSSDDPERLHKIMIPCSKKSESPQFYLVATSKTTVNQPNQP